MSNVPLPPGLGQEEVIAATIPDPASAQDAIDLVLPMAGQDVSTNATRPIERAYRARWRGRWQFLVMLEGRSDFIWIEDINGVWTEAETSDLAPQQG